MEMDDELFPVRFSLPLSCEPAATRGVARPEGRATQPLMGAEWPRPLKIWATQPVFFGMWPAVAKDVSCVTRAATSTIDSPG